MEYPQEKVKPYGSEGKKVEQVERMFDHIAPAYDRLNHLMSMGIDRRWRKKAIRWLAPFRPQDVMDVATGTGDFALLACRMLQPRALTGVDISEGMMQVARQKAQDAGLDGHIRFRREDCEALTFPDASFDAVTVAFGVRNFEHLDLGLREMSWPSACATSSTWTWGCGRCAACSVPAATSSSWSFPRPTAFP